MLVSKEWIEKVRQQYLDNARIRRAARQEGECGVADIAEEEELHSLLLIHCCGVIECQFDSDLDQQARVKSLHRVSTRLEEYNERMLRV